MDNENKGILKKSSGTKLQNPFLSTNPHHQSFRAITFGERDQEVMVNFWDNKFWDNNLRSI